ncbi:hypothetical protein EV182_000332 [Spiromyces aspiralis]|uniref:Uncharacterized protein n=1 Tax=Spiromyces aspiralis TaxID=68401 RepID=A0ACC1HL70_9FUNG|nr:hypothetical protein EV182_000332 [Spiromyces aspiralis]
MDMLNGGPGASQQASCADEALHDTVGAVCVDKSGHIAAGVSSGGIAIKIPGRLGEAALYGSGCWAAETEAGEGSDVEMVGCSVTGTGEQIVRTVLGREVSRIALNSEDWSAALSHHVKSLRQGHRVLARYPELSVGFGIIRGCKHGASIGRLGRNEHKDSAASRPSPALLDAQPNQLGSIDTATPVLRHGIEILVAHTTPSMVAINRSAKPYPQPCAPAVAECPVFVCLTLGLRVRKRRCAETKGYLGSKAETQTR